MFWESVMGGIALLRNWQASVAAASCMIVTLVAALLVARAQRGSHQASQDGAHPGSGAFRNAILHGAVTGFFLVFLLPILLGPAAMPVFQLAFAEPLVLIRTGGQAVFIAISLVMVMRLVPLFAGLTEDAPGILTLVEGVVIFQFLSLPVVGELVRAYGIEAPAYPDLWETAGFVAVAGVVLCVLLLLAALATLHMDERTADKLIRRIFVPLLSPLVGLLVVFMYSSYVRLSLEQLLTD